MGKFGIKGILIIGVLIGFGAWQKDLLTEYFEKAKGMFNGIIK